MKRILLTLFSILCACVVDAAKAPNFIITYAAMIEEMDLNVGALIDALKVKGELDNTYIIFTSDNGGGPSKEDAIQRVLALEGCQSDFS